MFTDALYELLRDLDTTLDVAGWDQPSALAELYLDPADDGLRLRSELHSVLTGNPVCDLWRRAPLVHPDAIGAVVVTEGWGYGPAARDEYQSGRPVGFGPAEDPDRVEVRTSQLVLRDGTEAAVVRHRGSDPVLLVASDGDRTDGWVVWLLRRCLAQPSQARVSYLDLGARLVLLWQVSSLLAIAEGGVDLSQVRPRDDEWGTFCLPGTGLDTSRFAAPWWAAADAARMHMDAGDTSGAWDDTREISRQVRRMLQAGDDTLPAAFALCRVDDHVMLDARNAAWADDALLAAFMDASVPALSTLARMAPDQLPAPLGDSLARFLDPWSA